MTGVVHYLSFQQGPFHTSLERPQSGGLADYWTFWAKKFEDKKLEQNESEKALIHFSSNSTTNNGLFIRFVSVIMEYVLLKCIVDILRKDQPTSTEIPTRARTFPHRVSTLSSRIECIGLFLRKGFMSGFRR